MSGTNTTLTGLSFTATEDNDASAYGNDLLGLVSLAEVKAGEMIQLLNLISSRLPNGDPNIATIATLITNLS